MVTIEVYVEGAGNSNLLKTKCRRAFSEFFRKAGLEGRIPRTLPCGGRNEAYDSFCTALRVRKDGVYPVLLVDSETPVENELPVKEASWPHLQSRDGWTKPADASDDQAHLMVQTMEAWFVADRDSLAGFFGREFNTNALPERDDVERISKDELYRSLENATRQCKKKGKYGKGKHSFNILAKIDPRVVQDKSPHAEHLIATLDRKTEGK